MEKLVNDLREHPVKTFFHFRMDSEELQKKADSNFSLIGASLRAMGVGLAVLALCIARMVKHLGTVACWPIVKAVLYVKMRREVLTGGDVKIIETGEENDSDDE